MANQMTREDLFTHIHKDIRSMIYELGAKLQKTDFANPSASEEIIGMLKHNLKSANSTCIICMLHDHGEPEMSVFPQLASYESKSIDIMIQEHAEVTRRIVEISRISDALLQLRDNDQRIQLGARLNKTVNDMLAFYLAHLNNEEEIILPLTWKYLTDDQMRAIRTKIQLATPPEKYAEWMRWIISSLNVNELIRMFSGIKAAAPPQVLERMKHMAEEILDHDTWNAVKTRVNI
jgi:hypothetical protein